MGLTVEMQLEQPNRAERLLAAASGQLPFATSLAINNTAKQFQQIQTRHILDRFTIRRETFARKAVKIKPFATKSRLEATVKIEPPGGQRTADIFARFEKGGRKTPRESGTLAVPVGVARQARERRDFRRARPAGYRAKGIGKRIFVVRHQEGRLSPGIYLRPPSGRAGAGELARGGLRRLFTFKRSVPIDDRLEFIDTAKRVIAQRFGPNFSEAFARALRTAR